MLCQDTLYYKLITFPKVQVIYGTLKKKTSDDLTKIDIR